MNHYQEVELLKELLRQWANPERAAGEKAYLKSSQQFYGVNMPTLRKIAKSWTKTHKTEPAAEVAEVASLLWDSDWHEERSLAVLLLQYCGPKLDLTVMPLIEKMIHEAAGWAHLDALATGVISALVDHDSATLAYLPRWAISDNFWVRRAAILAQVPQFRRGRGDINLFFRLVEPMFHEGKDWTREERFFIRKAIGWSLRELAPARPDLVFDFVQRHRSSMSNLTFHEATRKLPAAYRNRLA